MRRSSCCIEYGSFAQAGPAILGWLRQLPAIRRFIGLPGLASFAARGMHVAATVGARCCVLDRTFVRAEQQCRDRQVNEWEPHKARIRRGELTSSLALVAPVGNDDQSVAAASHRRTKIFSPAMDTFPALSRLAVP